jgi:hypothetical protein
MTAAAAIREFTAMAATTTIPVSQLSCRKICEIPVAMPYSQVSLA